MMIVGGGGGGDVGLENLHPYAREPGMIKERRKEVVVIGIVVAVSIIIMIIAFLVRSSFLDINTPATGRLVCLKGMVVEKILVAVFVDEEEDVNKRGYYKLMEGRWE
jgi:hypothetical protein